MSLVLSVSLSPSRLFLVQLGNRGAAAPMRRPAQRGRPVCIRVFGLGVRPAAEQAPETIHQRAEWTRAE
jgi:hypothetical protein